VVDLMLITIANFVFKNYLPFLKCCLKNFKLELTIYEDDIKFLLPLGYRYSHWIVFPEETSNGYENQNAYCSLIHPPKQGWMFLQFLQPSVSKLK
jgi:hypothetical protein